MKQMPHAIDVSAADMQAALEHHRAGRLPQAEALYRQVLERQPKHADALYFLGLMARQLGQQDVASDLILHAIAADAANPMYYNTLGNIHTDSGQYAAAAARYRQALACQPDYVEALFNLGKVLQQQGHADQAIASYRKALAVRPDYAEAHNDLAVALMAMGQLDAAIASFQQALRCQPGYAEAHNNLGVAYKKQGLVEEAAACYRRAIALRPNYAKALLNLGTLFFLQGNFAEATSWYEASLAVDPQQVEAHQNMAIICHEAGRLSEAQRHRDLAYGKQAVFIDSAPEPQRTVLVLWAAGWGNVPIQFLLPEKSTTRIIWMMEYANEAQARALPDYELVFNAIGDQDVTGPTAAPVERFLRDCRKPLLNHPAAVANTARERIAALFAPLANVVVPQSVRLAPENFREQLLSQAGMRMPLLLRPSGSHGGKHLVKLASVEELNALQPWQADAYHATNYHDYRSADGHYRKYRIVFVDRRPLPYHLAIGDDWMVHYQTAGMLDAAWKREEEARFLADPAEAIGPLAMAAVDAIGRQLDLDYCGLDFSVLADGRLLVFEANATMLVHPEVDDEVLFYKNPYVQRIFDAFNAHLARLAASVPA
jgi:tetratricopeptide (TPR) repeat protein